MRHVIDVQLLLNSIILLLLSGSTFTQPDPELVACHEQVDAATENITKNVFEMYPQFGEITKKPETELTNEERQILCDGNLEIHVRRLMIACDHCSPRVARQMEHLEMMLLSKFGKCDNVKVKPDLNRLKCTNLPPEPTGGTSSTSGGNGTAEESSGGSSSSESPESSSTDQPDFQLIDGLVVLALVAVGLLCCYCAICKKKKTKKRNQKSKKNRKKSKSASRKKGSGSLSGKKTMPKSESLEVAAKGGSSTIKATKSLVVQVKSKPKLLVKSKMVKTKSESKVVPLATKSKLKSTASGSTSETLSSKSSERSDVPFSVNAKSID